MELTAEEHEELLRVMEMFSILKAMAVTQLYAIAAIYQTVQ